MPRLYTRTGDLGETGLLVGGRVSKADPRVESYGTVDELNVFVGAARVEVEAGLPDGADRDLVLGTLDAVQDGLMRLAADLASGGQAAVGLTDDDVADLEARIDAASGRLPELRHFLVPGVTRAEAALHQCRVVCRRAQRRVVALGETHGPTARRVVYLNRVSDLMFALARLALQAQGRPERPWRGGTGR
ncbi:MAG TPA: cob(I)yrinic acid a,c-diamide adenosyltransferase [Myxococcota bacterium]|nr:cob(I)yrinic acid a,c-diamide adenosyltransferase [Myxococcota bacterium]